VFENNVLRARFEYETEEVTGGWKVHDKEVNNLYIIIIIIIISGSAVLVRTFAVSHWRFRNLIKTLGRTPSDEWSSRCKGLYLNRTTQHRYTNIHTWSGIRTHDPSNQAAKTYALDRATTGSAIICTLEVQSLLGCTAVF
jgi:hypothetical protein